MATAKKQAAKRSTSKKATATRAVAPKLGRPPKGEVPRTLGLTLRLTPQEKAELGAAATQRGLSVTDLVLAAVRSYGR